MSERDVQRDGSGKSYIEIPLDPGGRLRVTLVEESWVDGPAVRLQLRGDDGHLRQGPEIPAAAVGEVVGAVVQLMGRS